MTREFENLSIDEAAYMERVSEIANSQSDELISNSDKTHAKILIHQLLIRAKDNIKILSTSLDSSIYDDDRIVSAMEAIKSRGVVKLEILIQNPEKIEKSNRFLNLCRSYKNCTVKQITDPSADQLDQLKSHYITMDNKAYRFCADATKQHDPDDGSVKAVATFNRKETTALLNKLFERLFSRAPVLGLD